MAVTVGAATLAVVTGAMSALSIVSVVLAMLVLNLAAYSRLPYLLPLAALTAGAIAQSPYVLTQVGAGGRTLYVVDLLLPLAALVALSRPSRTKGHDAFVLLFGLVMAAAMVAGLVLHGWSAISQDVRGPAYLIMGYLVGSRLLPDVPTRTLRRGVLGLLVLVASGMLVQLSTGLTLLGGRVEGVRVYGGAVGGQAIDATRFLTNTKVLAMVALVVALAVLVSRSSTLASRRWALATLIPAFLITFLGYSRALLLSIAAAVLLLVFMTKALRARWLRPLAVVGALAAVGLFLSLTGHGNVVNDPEGNLLARQVASFEDRVVDGLTGDQLLSPGNEWRLVESRYAWESFVRSPLWGHGFGAEYRPRYVMVGAHDVFKDPTYGTRFIHNGHLGYLIRTGALGYGLFLLFFLLPAGRTLLAGIRGQVGPVQIGLAAAVIGLLVDQAFEPDLNRIGGAPVAGAIVGLLTYCCTRASVTADEAVTQQ